MTSSNTKSNVFIIESIGFDDEQDNLYEGKIFIANPASWFKRVSLLLRTDESRAEKGNQAFWGKPLPVPSSFLSRKPKPVDFVDDFGRNFLFRFS